MKFEVGAIVRILWAPQNVGLVLRRGTLGEVHDAGYSGEGVKSFNFWVVLDLAEGTTFLYPDADLIDFDDV